MTEPITPARLAELREIASAATPGPWEAGTDCWAETIITNQMLHGNATTDLQTERDHAHIAAFDPATALALLDALEQAQGDRPSGFWSQREWEDWSNDLALLIPEDDAAEYSNPEGAQEGIIEDCLRAYVDALDEARKRIERVEAVIAKAEKGQSPAAFFNGARLPVLVSTDALRAALGEVQ